MNDFLQWLTDTPVTLTPVALIATVLGSHVLIRKWF